MKTFREHKDSGINWLPVVPKHWDVLPNFAIFIERIERGFDEDDLLSVTIDQGIIKQESQTLKKDTSSDDKSNYKKVKTGDLAYNKMRMWQGAVGFSRYDGIVSPAYIVLKPRKVIESRYYHYLFRIPLYTNESYRNAHGIVLDQHSLRYPSFKRMYSPFPPLPEQQAIADFLDRKTAQIDTLIEKKQRQIDLLQEQRTALINHAVTKGLNPNVKMKDSGVEWLGEIPSHWGTAKAKQVSHIFVPQRNKPELNQEGDGLPWITTEDLTSAKIGKSTKNYFVSKSAATESGSKPLPAGSVIASCVGRFGVSSVSECELIINQQLQAYIPHNINPWFLHYFIIVSRHYFERVATASTLPYVNQENFGLLPITLPPLEEQKEIVLKIEKSNPLIDKAIKDYQQQIDHLSEYRTALISEAVTGKIDVRTAE